MDHTFFMEVLLLIFDTNECQDWRLEVFIVRQAFGPDDTIIR